MSFKNRLKMFIESEKISIRDFENSIGVSNGYVNNISKSVGIEKLSLIIEKYSNLNLEWLITGRGEMIKQDIYYKMEGNIVNDPEINYKTTPLFMENALIKQENTFLKKEIALKDKIIKLLEKQIDKL